MTVSELSDYITRMKTTKNLNFLKRKGMLVLLLGYALVFSTPALMFSINFMVDRNSNELYVVKTQEFTNTDGFFRKDFTQSYVGLLKTII